MLIRLFPENRSLALLFSKVLDTQYLYKSLTLDDDTHMSCHLHTYVDNKRTNFTPLLIAFMLVL